ncbi:MAG: SusC/RagA family TonB-linked outer membrane protein [Prevotellaceae bacterium]|jgi:TonB-linked SusC/RagA family outer membrane protein|nr:SusC/RagA family TonB-linked outer membrane protein [Prevotellaceae bacterium]
MKKFLMFSIACLFVSVSAFAQTKTVTGKIIGSDDGLGLPASVQVQGTTKGVSADIDGNYSIAVDRGQTLVISAIGYTAQEIVVGDANVIDVTLQVEAAQLTEAVVTALGIKKEKKALGYSVQDIKSEELLKNKTANPLNSLAGKVAGISVTQSSGAAGAGAHIILRGATSLSETRDNQPLFVVDGIIYDNSTSSVGNTAFDGMNGNATTNSNRVMDINTDDIENMSVLKGPAAAALYGSRAANGVIIITTKKGQEGGISVDFSSKFSAVWANRLPEQQSKYQRGERGTDGNLDPTKYTYSSWGDPISGQVYDNIGNFFQGGNIWDNMVSFSSGGKNGSVYMSVSRLDQEGIIPNTGYDKTTFRLNVEQKFGRLTVNAGAAYSQANTDKTLTSAALWGAGGNGSMSAVYQWARNDDMSHYLNDDGTKYRIYSGRPLGTLVENPYWIVNKNTMNDHTNRFTGNASADFKVADWFNVTYRFGLDNYTTGNYNMLAPGGEYSKSGYSDGMLSENELKHQYFSSNLMLNFNKQIGDFNLGMLLGWSEEETKRETNYRMGTEFSILDQPSFATIIDANKKLSQSHSLDRMRSFYGEFRASYKSIAYLTVTGRNDKSSTLYSPRVGDANASYFYPSVGGSFIFSELLPDNLKSLISFGKVRASWAKVGKATSPYATDTKLWPFQEFLGGITGTSTEWTRGNPYLKPEMTTSIELGLEVRFLKGRLGFDYTYYVNNSFDQIITPRTSQAPGYILYSLNAGEMYNKGMEISITGQPVKTRNFTWDATLNLSGNRSTVGSIYVGLPILYVTDVQIGNAKAASFENGNFMAISGSKWSRTEDGKVILDQWGRPTSDNVTTHNVGNREPKFFGGFNNSLQYKNWNLSFLLDFRIGGHVYNGTEYWLTTTGMSKQTENRESLTITGVVNTGTAANPVYEDKTFTFNADQDYPVSATATQNGKYIIQEYWRTYYPRESANFMTKTNWLRLRAVSLSYTLPQELLAKVKFIKACTVSFTGTNLLLITNYKGLDPEASVGGSGVGGSSSVGFDYNNVPATAGVSFGINLKF